MIENILETLITFSLCQTVWNISRLCADNDSIIKVTFLDVFCLSLHISMFKIVQNQK